MRTLCPKKQQGFVLIAALAILSLLNLFVLAAVNQNILRHRGAHNLHTYYQALNEAKQDLDKTENKINNNLLDHYPKKDFNQSITAYKTQAAWDSATKINHSRYQVEEVSSCHLHNLNPEGCAKSSARLLVITIKNTHFSNANVFLQSTFWVPQ